MATFNIAERGKGTNYIRFRGYYGGSASDRAAVQAQFYVDGRSIGQAQTNSGSRNWTTNDVTASGLNPGQRYGLQVRFFNSGYNEIGRTRTLYVTTESDTPPPPPADTTRPIVRWVDATPRAIAGAQNSYSIDLSWSASDNVGISHFWVYHSTPNNSTMYSIGREISGSARSLNIGTDANGNRFTEGRRYYFQVRAIDTSGNLSLVSTGETSIVIPATPPPKRPTLSKGTQTLTSASMSVSDWGSAQEFQVESRNSSNMSWISHGAGFRSSFTIGGLASGRTYDFRVRGKSGNLYSQYSNIVTFDITSARPSNWVWDTRFNIYRGGKFFDTSSDGKTFYLMTAAHWNSFTNRIRLFRQYKTPGNIPSFTQVGSGTTVTAAIINQAIDAINVMGFSMPRVVSGVTDVSASVFTTMSTNLNSIK